MGANVERGVPPSRWQIGQSSVQVAELPTAGGFDLFDHRGLVVGQMDTVDLFHGPSYEMLAG
jgi:hypothetical protein